MVSITDSVNCADDSLVSVFDSSNCSGDSVYDIFYHKEKMINDDLNVWVNTYIKIWEGRFVKFLTVTFQNIPIK